MIGNSKIETFNDGNQLVAGELGKNIALGSALRRTIRVCATLSKRRPHAFYFSLLSITPIISGKLARFFFCHLAKYRCHAVFP